MNGEEPMLLTMIDYDGFRRLGGGISIDLDCDTISVSRLRGRGRKATFLKASRRGKASPFPAAIPTKIS